MRISDWSSDVCSSDLIASASISAIVAGVSRQLSAVVMRSGYSATPATARNESARLSAAGTIVRRPPSDLATGSSKSPNKSARCVETNIFVNVLDAAHYRQCAPIDLKSDGEGKRGQGRVDL